MSDSGLRFRLPGRSLRIRDAELWVVLIRHFFGRFFDRESLSPQGDPTINITQALAFLATPGLFFILLFMTVTVTGWNLVAARCLFILFSMVLMGIVVVFEWDALFLDSRDYQILLPLPLPLWKLFVAKGIALGLFLGLFLLAANLFSALLWQIIDRGDDLPVLVATHVLVVSAAGLFAALSAAAVQGLLVIVLPLRVLRPVSLVVQTGLMAVLILLFFLSPFVADALGDMIAAHSRVVNYFPPFWFAGFYERLRPAVGNRTLLGLGRSAIPALGYAGALFFVTHLPGYRRQVRRAIESLQAKPPEPGRLRTALSRFVDRVLLKDPVEQAVFHFIGQTIGRSMKHRLFLASWAGFGLALAIIGNGPRRGLNRQGLSHLPLMLSFVVVSGLRAAFNFPAELRANWIFRISQAEDSPAWLIATRKWIMTCAIGPLFLLLLPVEFAFFPWPSVLFHVAFGFTMSVLLTEAMFFGFQKIPFTCAYFPGKINLVWLVILYVLGFTFYSSALAGFELRLIERPREAVGFLVAACLAGFFATRFWRWLSNSAADIDYDGAGDPVVRTLELTAR